MLIYLYTLYRRMLTRLDSNFNGKKKILASVSIFYDEKNYSVQYSTWGQYAVSHQLSWISDH